MLLLQGGWRRVVRGPRRERFCCGLLLLGAAQAFTCAPWQPSCAAGRPSPRAWPCRACGCPAAIEEEGVSRAEVGGQVERCWHQVFHNAVQTKAQLAGPTAAAVRHSCRLAGDQLLRSVGTSAAVCSLLHGPSEVGIAAPTQLVLLDREAALPSNSSYCSSKSTAASASWTCQVRKLQTKLQARLRPCCLP